MQTFRLFATWSNLYKTCIVILLTWILIVQTMIYLRMPPTIGELRAATNIEKRTSLLYKIPLINGNVTCQTTRND
jgi:hypothetical protein